MTRKAVSLAGEARSIPIYRHLRERILGGGLQPGERLVLRRLGDAYGVSEIPVREAVRMLERDGLVEVVPNAGARVASLSEDEVEEVFFLRAHLEGLAAECAVPHLDPSALAALGRGLRAMREAVAASDALRYGALNRAFHQDLYAACPYRRLYDLIFGIWDGGAKFRLVFQLRPARMRASLAEHERIDAAARAGDAVTCGRLVREHKLAAGRALAAYLREESGGRRERAVTAAGAGDPDAARDPLSPDS